MYLIYFQQWESRIHTNFNLEKVLVINYIITYFKIFKKFNETLFKIILLLLFFQSIKHFPKSKYKIIIKYSIKIKLCNSSQPQLKYQKFVFYYHSFFLLCLIFTHSKYSYCDEDIDCILHLINTIKKLQLIFKYLTF